MGNLNGSTGKRLDDDPTDFDAFHGNFTVHRQQQQQQQQHPTRPASTEGTQRVPPEPAPPPLSMTIPAAPRPTSYLPHPHPGPSQSPTPSSSSSSSSLVSPAKPASTTTSPLSGKPASPTSILTSSPASHLSVSLTDKANVPSHDTARKQPLTGPSSGSSTAAVLRSRSASPPVRLDWDSRAAEPELLPTMFTWTWGGSKVYVTGTWDNWQTRIPLNQSTHDFTAIANLPPGIHSYKFIVDGRWKHAPEQPVVTDGHGDVNNLLEIQVYDTAELQASSAASPPGQYGQFLSPQEFPTTAQQPAPASYFDYSKPPPALPPHLQRSVLNMPQLEEDSQMLPLPHHVMLNHLYLMRRETGQDMVILGTTTRYRSKFVTTVFYKPVI